MSPIKIAAVYVAANILLLFWLAIRVVVRRLKGQVSIGDGGSDELALAIRVHGNASEYIPAVLIGLVVAALICPQDKAWVIHLLGATFTTARVFHALGFGRSIIKLRQLGIMLSWLTMVAMSGILLWFALG